MHVPVISLTRTEIAGGGLAFEPVEVRADR
jgi:hypothetical protein